MTAGNNGASTPENDDPFGYLYRSEGGDGEPGASAAPRTGGYGYPGPAQPGVPRTSYNKVTRVGERQYGQQAQQAQQAQASAPYASQTRAHYAAPETLPGGAPRQPAPPSRGRGSGRGPNSRGLLLGAIAVVAVVVIGIGVAMLTNDSGDDNTPQRANNTSSAEPTGNDEPEEEMPVAENKPFSKKEDAASLRLEGPYSVARDIPGARSDSGTYVTMSSVGATATWTVNVPKSGPYTLFMGYGVPGKDADVTLLINGKPRSEPQKLKNYAMAKENEWDKGWTRSYAWIDLNKGTNTIQFSCQAGNQCAFVLDQVWMKTGQVAK